LYNFITMEYMVSFLLYISNSDTVNLSRVYEYIIKTDEIIKKSINNIVFEFSDNKAREMIYSYPEHFKFKHNKTAIRRIVSKQKLLKDFISYLPTEVLLVLQKDLRINK